MEVIKTRERERGGGGMVDAMYDRFPFFLVLESCCTQTSLCIHLRIAVKYNKLSFKSYLKDSRKITGRMKHNEQDNILGSVWKRVEFYPCIDYCY